MIIEQYRAGREEKEETVDTIFDVQNFFLFLELCGQLSEFTHTVIRRTREFSFRFKSRLPISSPARAVVRDASQRFYFSRVDARGKDNKF